jgi:hypothetical protein
MTLDTLLPPVLPFDRLPRQRSFGTDYYALCIWRQNTAGYMKYRELTLAFGNTVAHLVGNR